MKTYIGEDAVARAKAEIGATRGPGPIVEFLVWHGRDGRDTMVNCDTVDLLDRVMDDRLSLMRARDYYAMDRTSQAAERAAAHIDRGYYDLRCRPRVTLSDLRGRWVGTKVKVHGQLAVVGRIERNGDAVVAHVGIYANYQEREICGSIAEVDAALAAICERE